MNDQLSKFEGSDIIKWAKELKHNEKVARKYEGVTTVKDILQKAREDGYNFTEKELLDFNLDLVAGGAGDIGSGNTVDLDIGDKKDTTSTQQFTNENTLDMKADTTGNNNAINVSNSNSVTQS